jgi:CheY-like chemotaxis protein
MAEARDKADGPVGLLLSDDLLFTSRILGTARALGLTLQSARTGEALLALARERRPACVLVDLGSSGLVIADWMRRLCEACAPMTYVVAYGAHVDTAGLRAAREAGCNLVLPRGKFVEELPRELAGWMAAVSRE